MTPSHTPEASRSELSPTGLKLLGWHRKLSLLARRIFFWSVPLNAVGGMLLAASTFIFPGRITGEILVLGLLFQTVLWAGVVLCAILSRPMIIFFFFVRYTLAQLLGFVLTVGTLGYLVIYHARWNNTWPVLALMGFCLAFYTWLNHFDPEQDTPIPIVKPESAPTPPPAA